MSWNLQAAEMKNPYIMEDDIWKSIHYFFYHSKTTTTYKYGFFKALLDNVANANDEKEISFEDIFYSFSKIYWNLVVHHQLWQSNSRSQVSSVQKIIEAFQQEHHIPTEWNFDQLPTELQQDLIRAVKKLGKKYVIGALYGDFNGEIYTFDLKKEYLKLNLKYYHFFHTYKRILTNVTNYQLALFLEKFNEVEKVNQLLLKVEFVTKRQSLKEFALLLQKAGIHHCFYCNKSIKKNIHVDHFIPWSYIQNDQLWNFVLSCPTRNTSKNNKLPIEKYLAAIIQQNEALMVKETLKDYFVNYNEEKLKTLYKYSEKNGFRKEWEPRG